MQQFECSMQMALNGVDGHLQNLGNLGGLEVFLKTQRDNHAWLFRKGRDQTTQLAGQHQLLGWSRGCRFRQLLQTDLWPMVVSANTVNTAVTCHSTQPELQVRQRLNLRQRAVKLEEYFL